MILMFHQVCTSCMTMLEAISKFIQCDTIKKSVSSILGKDDSSFTTETFNTDEFSGIIKFQSLFSAVYLQKDKPIMITKSGKNEGDNTKVFCWMSNQKDCSN